MKTRLTRTRTLVLAALIAAVGAWYLIWGAVPEKRRATETPRVARPVKTMVVVAAGSGGERVFPGKVTASQKIGRASCRERV